MAEAATFGNRPSLLTELANLFAAAASDNPATLKSLRLGDFSVASASNEVTPAGIRLSHVRLRQHVDGIPVWGTYVSMTAKPADIRGSAKLMASSHHVYAGVKAATEPELTLETAAGLARVANRMTGSPVVAESRLILWPLEGSLDLVWSIKFQDSYYRALVYASGDLAGRVLRVDERHYQVSGTVSSVVTLPLAARPVEAERPTRRLCRGSKSVATAWW